MIPCTDLLPYCEPLASVPTWPLWKLLLVAWEILMALRVAHLVRALLQRLLDGTNDAVARSRAKYDEAQLQKFRHNTSLPL